MIFIRVRGLHLRQAGVFAATSSTSASLFDLALLVLPGGPGAAEAPAVHLHPQVASRPRRRCGGATLCAALARAEGWLADAIKCMALVESHPLAYQMEEFLYNLRDHLLGPEPGPLGLHGEPDPLQPADPRWVLPDRNTIPHDVPFFQRLRELLPEICHKHGLLAIGGMTALFPSRADPELNARALAVLEKDKRNEALALMDGAWTGHPDQNEIAVAQFPPPNQLGLRRADRRALSRPAARAGRRRAAHGGRHPRRRARHDPLPQRRARAARARACSTATWRTWRPTASTG